MVLVSGRSVIGISGSLIWSEVLMELIFNPCGEFLASPEGPVSQIHTPHLHVCAPGIFSDLLRSVQMLKREQGAESNGKLPHLFIPSKMLPWFQVCGGIPAFGQNCNLGSFICSERCALGQNTLMMMMMMMVIVLDSSVVRPVALEARGPDTQEFQQALIQVLVELNKIFRNNKFLLVSLKKIYISWLDIPVFSVLILSVNTLTQTLIFLSKKGSILHNRRTSVSCLLWCYLLLSKLIGV